MDSLISSIEQYQNQLEQVNNALLVADESEKKELQELQLNLLQLLELTLNQVESSKEEPSSVKNESSSATSASEDNLDEEFALFKTEIAELSGEEKVDKNASPGNDLTKEEEEIIAKLKTLEGEQVRAPFVEKWGGYTYHNALVLNIALNEKNLPDFDDPKVVVLFNQPTSNSMVPCQYFLDGRCNFTCETCKFSHGSHIAVSDIKPYQETEPNSIIAGSSVLALHKGNIWHKGKVDDVLEDRSAFSFNCEVCHDVFDLGLNALVLIGIDDAETEITTEDKDNINECDVESDFVPNAQWLQSANAKQFGDWEKYTKGIGSKLMSKMGYILGTGLGPTGKGKINPVATYVYPQGVSLDRCMELRQRSNGEEFLEVEKKLLRMQKKEEDKQKRQAEYISQKASVFDIINKKLDGKSSASTSEGSKQRLDVSRKSLKRDSTKALNRKNLQLGCQIMKVEGEIKKLNESKERQANDQLTSKTIETKLSEKETELQSLKAAENIIKAEQKNRRDAKSSFVF